MKFSYSWIRGFVEGLDLSPLELENLITLKTAECEGIEEFPSEDADVPSDYVIEIDNKSLTHRPDLWGHLGMAREVAAFAGKRLLDPVKLDLLPAGPALVQVAIEDLDLCPRYSALVFENVTVQPSPPWLQYRLQAIGQNPINNIVDFTNYVAVELAQPTHAFDRALLKGDTIYIRPARPGERIVALDDEEYDLDASNLVIADAGGPVALAGVIGGRDTAINASTRSIVLESANFHGASIRKTSASLKIRTDASMRFEKSQDPVNTTRGLARAIELLDQLSPGIRLAGGLADQYKTIPDPPPILLPLDWLIRKLGRDISAAQVREILESLAFTVAEPAPRVLEVRVPSWRATRDISIKDDLVEEIGRMIGYGSIVPTAPLIRAGAPPDNPERTFLRVTRALMTAQGFTEVSNYSFVNEEEVRVFGFEPADHLAVANPIASDQGLLRLSLLPGIRRNILENSKHFNTFRLFEIGREIHKQSSAHPVEIPHLAAVVYDKDGDGAAGLFEAKRTAESLLPGAILVPGASRCYEHPARAAIVEWQGLDAGRLFELHPSIVEGRAAVLYINLANVQVAGKPEVQYSSPRRFPSSAFDLSVVTGGRELVGDLRGKLIAFVPPQLLESIEYVRQYSGPPFEAGQKSVSFRISLAAPDRTLSSEEVSAIRQAMIDGMRVHGYDLRV